MIMAKRLEARETQQVVTLLVVVEAQEATPATINVLLQQLMKLL